MRYVLAAAITGLLLLSSAIPARADYFVWRDANTGMTISYPDTWRVVSNEQPDDMLTIMAPSGNDYAECRVRIRDDMRWAIFPPRYGSDIQQVDYSGAFWDKYLHDFTDPQIYNMKDEAGFGRGPASIAEAGYWAAVPGPMMQKESLLFASLYNNHVYILDCSAQAQAYPKWKMDFLGIAKSADFVKANHELFNGYYRNFMEDERQRFQNPDGETLTYY
jgi:hypothetical protein